MADVQALELIRAEANVPTVRWCARLGIPRATWYRRLHRALHGAGPKDP